MHNAIEFCCVLGQARHLCSCAALYVHPPSQCTSTSAATATLGVTVRACCLDGLRAPLYAQRDCEPRSDPEPSSPPAQLTPAVRSNALRQHGYFCCCDV